MESAFAAEISEVAAARELSRRRGDLTTGSIVDVSGGRADYRARPGDCIARLEVGGELRWVVFAGGEARPLGCDVT